MGAQSLNDLIARYRRAVAEEWRYLTVTVHGEERRLPLERVFFMLQARERPEPKGTEPPRPDLDPAELRFQHAGVLKAQLGRVEVGTRRLGPLRFGSLPRLEHEEDALQRQAAFLAVHGDCQVSPFLRDGAPVTRDQVVQGLCAHASLVPFHPMRLVGSGGRPLPMAIIAMRGALA